MITKIKDASDAMAAYAENLELVIEGKRNLAVATVVHKNLTGMTNLAKTQVLEKLRTGDKTPLMWLWVDEPKKIGEKPKEESTSTSE